MSVQAPAAQVQVGQVRPPARPAQAEDSICQKTLRAIMEVVIRVLVPLSAAALLYFTLPLSISVIAIPVATLASIIATNLLFTRAKQEPALPMTASAPSGLRNMGGNDCWMNSLAQIMRMDRGMRAWFQNVPTGLVEHANWFQYFSQDLIENLPLPAVPLALPPEAYGNLAVNDVAGRAAVDVYANWVRGMPAIEKQNLFRYLRFLRRFPIVENPDAGPREVAQGLLAFRNYIRAYNDGARQPGQPLTVPLPPAPPPQANQPPAPPREPALFNSHNLRMAIARVFPQINQVGEAVNENSQQDPTEALPAIALYFLPDHLKVRMQVRRHFQLPTNEQTGLPQPIVNPAIGDRISADGKVITTTEEAQLPIMNCGMEGSHPNARNLLERYFEQRNQDPDNRIKRTVDQVEYTFPLVKTETQFTTAPQSFWLPVKRFRRIEPQWAGLHRMMPDLFHAEPAGQVKNEASVEFQESLEITAVNGEHGNYRLDGFICHLGKTARSGHYISYERGVDNAWYKMDDSVVTRVSETQMQEAREKAYMTHYSKIIEA